MNTSPPRLGDWGTAYTGRQYWPMDPRPGDIDIRDIAHALSLLCRFGGHCARFYSVAEHSVHASRLAERLALGSSGGGTVHRTRCWEAAMWGLLHDAPEAYLVDVPRPLKRSPAMAEYVRLEGEWERAIAEAFDLPDGMPWAAKEADEFMLATEARDLMPPASVERWTLTHTPLHDLTVAKPMQAIEAERAFLQRFAELTCAGEVA